MTQILDIIVDDRFCFNHSLMQRVFNGLQGAKYLTMHCDICSVIKSAAVDLTYVDHSVRAA
jgi:hypothetical protein